MNDYLEGSGVVTSIAAADFLTSALTGNFDALLQTTSINPKTAGEISTSLAKQWFRQALMNGSEKNDTAPYDKNKEKFILNNEERVVFRTLSDWMLALKNLTPAQRFAIAHKALLDKGGALTNPKNKEILGKRLVESLGLSSGFVSSVLKAACLEADAKLIGFPTASMLGPLLFRAIDVNEVDLKEVGKGFIYRNQGDDVELNTLLSENDISNILRTNTRDITLFGPKYQTNPDSVAAKLCRESDFKYNQITDRLNTLFNKPENGKEQPAEKAEIDQAMEAVIKGVEASGALGIRALQLASQFSKLEPALEKRLSESLDSNPGLNKLLFWENLHKLAEEDQSIKTFLQRITLHDYLGGGSLQTTYGATYRDDDGSEREVILKMKNPNVAAFIRESYSSAHKALEVVSNQWFAGKKTESAKTGMALMDLAQKWCLDDLNDTSFIKDDDLFRETIAKYNSSTGSDQFYAPVRILTHNKLKSEDLAQGKTVNKLLNDPDVNPETKKEIVQMLSKFFVYQFRGNSFMQEHGEKYFLVHSDPHVGNYIADILGEKPKIGVIDRSLYLKLEDKDVDVLEKLMVKGNTTEFAESFIDRILDINKEKGLHRAAVKNKVFAKLLIDSAYQMARGGIDRFALMRTMLTELSNSDMDVPLNLRLMIRNIGAFQELTKKYGVELEQITKKEEKKE